ncbi:MAG: sugar phosphate isomerase/epimerase, partial [Verrucomicrobia bacterium]
SVYFGRDGRRFGEELDAHLTEVARCGLDGLEPTAGSPEDAKRMGEGLRKAGLEMRSLYVNSTLHEREQAHQSIDRILQIARAAAAHGCRIIVTNPNPIRWGGTETKNDQQLRTQARALNVLGTELHDLGLQLAYHNHDIELRHAAREFHHMMVATDPRFVRLCLDAHWIYRGSGNSQVALFDVVELYGDRVTELHVRQSHHGIWSEVFTAKDDIDYPRLVAALVRKRAKPLVVLEQAVESGTPKTMRAGEALSRSAEEARRVFAPFAA